MDEFRMDDGRLIVVLKCCSDDKDVCVLEVDDETDEDIMSILLERQPPIVSEERIPFVLESL